LEAIDYLPLAPNVVKTVGGHEERGNGYAEKDGFNQTRLSGSEPPELPLVNRSNVDSIPFDASQELIDRYIVGVKINFPSLVRELLTLLTGSCARRHRPSFRLLLANQLSYADNPNIADDPCYSLPRLEVACR